MQRLLGLLLLALLMEPCPDGRAQTTRYHTRAGMVSFFSASPLEDIEARSQQLAAVLDARSGQLAFTVSIRSFQFKRSLMQEHFNENYLESEKYPKATFSGRILEWKPEVLTATGAVAVVAEGDLTMHGVTRHIRVPGTLTPLNNQLLMNASFSVAPAEYNIDIPALVRDHIAKNILITVRLACAPVPGAAAVSQP
ncbi:YceI family protein [Hymenobacter metallilatus]|uniref:YceI family protein n=1 Tax=Hymenobacter metallilatus TaxID=2493666 RepID=A0A3R9PEE5_9BACT|nr:YceI family protein [Hymenobacter metallilatus]RSK35332.1 YceI family protein [Hymenobacter metallilatus]